MKIKIEIKHYLTGGVLFEFEKENNTLKDTVVEANLRGANLSWANLSEADLRGADLSEADLRWANLRGADLRGADLREANLSEADLRWANLSEADLSWANLRWANLRGANLSEADLRGADLSEADLRWANLSEADLSWANLRWANLRGANLRGAKNLDSNCTDFWWHIHHEVLVEYLNEPIRARINYIKENKPKEEIETRLRLLKPVLGKIPNTEKGWERLHKKECNGCPWNGTTIFPEK